jgi:GNAT superfamily N-acetyltransferase
MSDVTIRLARSDDLSRIPAIETSAAEIFTRYGQSLAYGWSPTQPEHCEAPLAAGLLWIAEDETGPFGFLAAEVVGDTLHVEEVDVVLARQRQGHGRRLVQAAIDAARARGLAAVTLTTFRTIPWNAPFYTSLGFVELPPDAVPARLAEEIEPRRLGHGYAERCAMRLSL